MAEAAHGGWLLDAERDCLYKATRRKRTSFEASRLLLADADARSDLWSWVTLAEQHLQASPHDGDIWMELAERTKRDGRASDVVDITNAALSAREAWSAPGDDPRVVALLRMRTYAAVDARTTRGIGDEVVRYAREWLRAARDDAPGVAWQLAGESRETLASAVGAGE